MNIFSDRAYNFYKINSFYFVILLLILLAAILPKRYEANDDVFIDLVLNGYFTGSIENGSLFSHFFLTKLLSYLYMIAPNVNIFNIFNIFILLFSTILIIWLVNNQKSYFLIVIIVGFYCNFLMHLNFSVIAFIAGYASIRYFLSAPNNNYKILDLSVFFLLLFSICLRFEFFLLAFFLNLPYIIQNYSKNKKIYLRYLIVLISLSLIIHFSNDLLYKNDQKWSKDYNEYKLQSGLADNPCFDKFYVKPHLNKIGWTENDLQMYLDFYFDIPKSLNNENLIYLKNVLPRNPMHFWDFIISIIIYVPWYFWGIIIFSWIFSYLNYGRKQLLIQVLSFIFIFFVLKYLTGSKIIFKERFIYSILYGLLINSFYPINFNNSVNKFSSKFLLIPMILMLFSVLINYNKIKEDEILLRSLNIDLKNRCRNHFVFDYYHYYPVQGFENYKNSQNQFNGIKILPYGWVNNTPMGFSYLKRLGFKSLIEAISNNNTIHIVPKYNLPKYKLTMKQYFFEKKKIAIDFIILDSFSNKDYLLLKISFNQH